jgi:hypothetical protein
MAEEATPAVDPNWPAYRHHPTLPMVLCENEAEEKALPAGYRATPYTEEEADAWTAAQPTEGEAHTRRSHR